ncbi:hypothetical protein [Actinomycetospora cinnamomea]|uniref:Uncharacterized protein n=1 Tax=Actinomycetospora cinnamomea TaxID=663609 RepID=A0A2U1E519_9PSEU|nr:hypothetical protein [Actinomycetospora cinnamomea]PVY95037.1 hypothetical protein C8D89_1423 [Actinomycetospora cinnamomea]
MDHGRPGSLHTAQTFVPGLGHGPFHPSVGPDVAGAQPAAGPRHPAAGQAAVAGPRRFLPRAVLVGAATALAAAGIAAGVLLATAHEPEPEPTPAPGPVAAAHQPDHCDDPVRTITGRVAVKRDARNVPVGVVEVVTATDCGSDSGRSTSLAR